MRKIFSPRIALFAFIALAITTAISTPSFAAIGISVSFGPPPLPVYEQPICPGDGYLWTPGYWGWDADIDDYYWIPGTWVLAPEVGFFWTPPYWAWADGVYAFYDGYWGPEIGFYGGIDYGFGYFGTGFVGGRWEGGHFFYNRAVLNINVENIHNVYVENVNHTVINHVSYNGGEGGVNARPTPREEAAVRQRHLGPVAAQTQHINAARGNPELRASANHGKPPIAATARPGDFKSGAMPAREAGGEYKAHPSHGAGAPRAETAGGTHANHPSDLAPIERNTPNTGNPKQDKKYQQQQDKMIAKQNQERQKLQQQQDKEHAKMAKQSTDQVKQQQLEQKHQQQTEQLQQRHTEQRQQLQQKYSRPPARGGGKK